MVQLKHVSWRVFPGRVFGVLMMCFLAVPLGVSADAWWGKGARQSEWVLSYGGTIIRYEIRNISGESEEYKAVMYDKKGKYVEKEFGTKAVFDDAKDGEYTIRAYRGDGGTEFKSTHKGGKEFAEVSVMAHPGETIKLVFDYKKKKVSMTTDYVKPVPKPIAKAAPKKPVLVPPVALVPEQQSPEFISEMYVEVKSVETSTAVNLVSDLQFEEGASLTCSDPQKKSPEKKGFVQTEDTDSFFSETIDDFIHPEAMAMEGNISASFNEMQTVEVVSNGRGFFPTIADFFRKLFSL